MKKLNKTKDIYIDPQGKAGDLSIIENGLHVRDVYIHAGIGKEICIGHTSDLHFNYCNAEDMAEANPAVMSTLEHRVWQSNAKALPNAQRALAFLDEQCEATVVNGDTLDYLSHGAMELMERNVWGAYPDIIATVGGHDSTRQMQGEVEDPTTRESRLKILEDFWHHDIYYHSKLIGDKVLIVALCNDLAIFNEYQLNCFRRDLALAEKNGYVMLIFAHEPFCTHNPAEREIKKEDVILLGDKSGWPMNFCDGYECGKEPSFTGSEGCDETTNALYRLMVTNADIVKGVFAGHRHSHMYTEIIAKNSDGSDAIIPQYVNTANSYHFGHVMRICVK